MPAVLQSTVRILILPNEELGRFTTAMIVCLSLQAGAVAAMVSRQVSSLPFSLAVLHLRLLPYLASDGRLPLHANR